MRILVASHSHPALSKGGAEIAAYRLFNVLKDRPGFESWFLGCARDQVHYKPGATISQPFSEREYLYAAGSFDWFKFANTDPKFPREFRSLLGDLSPDVVHFHHYLNFGVEAFHHVREALPKCRIVLTLHEFLALCHHHGQMVTKPKNELCYEASPIRCSGCFNEIAAADFFLRTLYIKRFFGLVDQFIAPSEFLALRYVTWGVPAERIAVIENLVAPTLQDPAATTGVRSDGALLRVGFFGQVSSLKGINVLFDAAAILEERRINNVAFEIHGDYSGQPPDLQADFLARLEKVGHNVRFLGAYDQQRVDRLMQAVDLVLVPSIWWENSPVVIQEALRNRRVVVCSDIGGMAEKVRNGIDGLHFPVGNPVALASLLVKLAAAPERLAALAAAIRIPQPAGQTVDRYVDLYARPRIPPRDTDSGAVHHA